MGQNIVAQDVDKVTETLSPMQNDSLKMKLLDDISLRFARKQPDSGIYFFEKILLYGKDKKDPSIIAESYLNLGINYFSKDSYNKAEHYLDSTQYIVNHHPELQKIYCHLLLVRGSTQYVYKHYTKSLFFFRAGLKIAKKNHYKTLQMKLLNNLAVGYRLINFDKKAIKCFRDNIKNMDTLKERIFYKTSLFNLANTYYKIKKLDSSEYYQNRLLSILNPDTDKTYIGETYFLKAKINKDNNLIDNAITDINKAINIYKDRRFLIFQADLFQIKKDYHQAEKAYLASQKLYDQFEDKKGIEKLYKGMGTLYQKTGKYKLAYHYLRLYKDYINEVNAIEKFNQIAEIQTKFDLETKDKKIQKQKEILIKKSEINENKKRNVLLIFFMLMGLLLLLFNFMNKRHTQQQIRLIDQQENERLRIAGDLHSSIGSHLSYIVSEINSVLFVPEQNKTQIIEQVKDIKHFTTESIAQFRDILWLLKKETFTVQDFYDRFKYYLSRISNNQKDFKFYINNTIPGIHVLNRKKTIITFRALQSSIDFIVKNSPINFLSIKFETSPKKIIYINISDDKNLMSNIDYENNQKFKIIKQHLSEINAKVSISKNNHNTSLTIIIP